MLSLSEAIRMGAMIRPQGFFCLVTWEGAEQRTCAFGAALEAIGKLGKQIGNGPPQWKLYERTRIVCPACMSALHARGDFMIHLNDTHRWTREAIADRISLYETEDTSVVLHEKQEEAWTKS